MKTIVNIADSLLEEARKLAHKEQTTIKALLEEGLRRTLTEHKRTTPFKLRKATFKGKGLHPDMAGASWEEIRDAAYKGRGG